LQNQPPHQLKLVFPSLEKGGEIGAPYFILYSKNDCQHGFLLPVRTVFKPGGLADFLPVGQEEYPGLPGEVVH
jgi:hypothetical protein